MKRKEMARILATLCRVRKSCFYNMITGEDLICPLKDIAVHCSKVKPKHWLEVDVPKLKGK